MSRLGAGIISYFTLLKVSVFFFLIASLLNIPLLQGYYNHAKNHSNQKFESIAIRFSFGNLGEAETLCTRVKLNSNFAKLRCNSGKIHSISDWGIYSLGSTAESSNSCEN